MPLGREQPQSRTIEIMRIHLAYSDEPLIAGQDAYAACEVAISKAQFPFIFDLKFEDSANLNSLRICAKCYALVNKTSRYLYGVVNGQEAMTLEAENEQM